MGFGKVNREKMQETEFSKSIEFRPKEGVSQVRVLPPHELTDQWFQKSIEHWVDGAGHIPCPRQFGSPCPICEEGERLYQSGDESSVKASLELRPREQYYFNVVVFTSGDGKNTPKDGVKIMRTGVKIFKQLKKLDNDEASGWGDMTNPVTGFNVTISRDGKGRTDTEYTVSPVNSRGVDLSSMLAAHNVPFAVIENGVHNLDEYVRSLSVSYEELKLKFENKQVAPGFPGGPRTVLMPLVAPIPVHFDQTADEPMFKNSSQQLTGVIAPPIIEE